MNGLSTSMNPRIDPACSNHSNIPTKTSFQRLLQFTLDRSLDRAVLLPVLDLESLKFRSIVQATRQRYLNLLGSRGTAKNDVVSCDDAKLETTVVLGTRMILSFSRSCFCCCLIEGRIVVKACTHWLWMTASSVDNATTGILIVRQPIIFYWI